MDGGSVLVDSNVYIGLLRRGFDPAHVLRRWAGYADLATCGMVRLEVERGLRYERVRRHMRAFFDVLVMIPSSNHAWTRATELAWSLDRRGITLPSQDCLIAACAQLAGAAVLSDDGHFESIPGIEFFRPSEQLDCW